MNSLLSNTKTFYQKVCGISRVLFNGVNDRTQDDSKTGSLKGDLIFSSRH